MAMAGGGASCGRTGALVATATLLAAMVPLGAGVSAKDTACPVRDPYSIEPSPFGWPLSPADWTWTRPDCWDKAHLICGGQRQSPININSNLPSCAATTVNTSDGVLASSDVASYSAAPVTKAQISKYMGTAMVEGEFGHLTLQNGNEPVTFDAVQVHLATPSLHTVDGQHYDAEMLVLHRPRDAKDMLSNGVIVSVLYRHSDNASSDVFKGMGFYDDDEEMVRLAPAWDILYEINLPADIGPALHGKSFLYNGSVPVPPCSETIKWVILAEPQHVSPRQTAKLQKMLRQHAGGVQHRLPQSRALHSKMENCQEIAVNTVQIGGSHEDATCEAAKEAGKGLLSARCWDLVDPCWNKRYSAVDIPTKGTVSLEDEKFGNVHHGETIVHYKRINFVKVSPSEYSLDAVVDNHKIMKDDGHRNFGHLLLNGHIFFARSISVKAISQHTVNGQHYAGEVQIEHVLFGDTFGEGMPGYNRDVHKVMVSVFLKLGRENTLLRTLEVFKNKASIRDRVPYHLDESIMVDLAAELEPALSGPWYWYSSNSSRRGCGSSVRWMVFEVPLEVNLDQLNCLSLQVSGVDSSQVPRSVPRGNIWKEHLPNHAVELNETDCGFLPRTDWKYGESHPHWDHGNERCWNTGYPLCSEGRRQSPIDIWMNNFSEVGTTSFLAKCSWKPISGLDVINTGHGLQVNSDQMGYISLVNDGGFLEFYHVVQFHVHFPSEHMINGRQYAAELHIVHVRKDSVGPQHKEEGPDLLVVAIMFDIGTESSPLLDQMYLPGAEEVLKQQGLHPKNFLADGMVIDEEDERQKVKRPIDLMRALGPVLEGPYYRYDGSLTTPPCSETVKWFVFGTPLMMSQAQWLSFKVLYPNPENNRPIQPLNGREVALNSFQEGTIAEYDFYLNRFRGRNRSDFAPSQWSILAPIIFSVLLATYVMASTFVQEVRQRKLQSAGGLAETLGRPAYTHLP